MKGFLLITFVCLFFISCVDEKGTIEGSFDFELQGFDYDVNPPKVLHNKTTKPYDNSTTTQLKVVTGPEILDCASFTHFAVTETNTAPADSAFSYSCSVSGSQNFTYNLTDTTEGSRTLYFWGKDKNRGKVSASSSLSFILDTTDPVASLTSTPTGVIAGGSLQSLTLSLSDNIALDDYDLEISPDGIIWSSLGSYSPGFLSPTMTTPLYDSSSVALRLTARDRAANTITDTSTSFTVDSTAPSVSVTDLAAYVEGGSSQNVNFNTTDLNGLATWELQYSSDGGSTFTTIATDPTSPYSWTAPTAETSNGLIRLYSEDIVGNSATTQTASFFIDSTPPAVSINDLASPVRGGFPETVNFSASDANGIASLTLEYAADGTTYSTLASVTGSTSYTWSVPSVNTTASRLRVTAIDSAGNINTAITSPFIIDSTPPSATLADLATAIQGGSTTAVNFTASDLNGLASVVLNYAADGTTFSTTLVTNPTSPYSWSVPSVDTSASKLQLVVTDNAGNVTTIANAAFAIDSTPPTLTLNDPAALLRGGNTESLTFTTNDTNGMGSWTLRYASDGTTFTDVASNPTSPYTWTIPSDDTSTARLRLVGVDSVGNTTSVTTNAFTIDSTIPSLTLDNLAAVIKGGGTESVTFTASDTNGLSTLVLEYAADGSTFTPLQSSPTSPYSWTVPLSDTTGSRLKLSATDNAGNSTSVMNNTFNIDSTAPSLTLSDMALIIRGGISNTVTHTQSDANGVASTELLYAQDGINFVSVTANPALSYSWATPAVDLTTARLKLTGTDVVGNSTEVINSVFEIDSTAPSSTISTPSSPILGGSTYNINFTTTDTNGIGSMSIEYAADGTNFSTTLTTTNSSPYAWTLPTTDTTGSKIRIVSTDPVGNQSIVESGVFNIDSTPSPAPTLTLTSPVYTNITSNTFTAGNCTDVSAILINEGTQPTAGDAAWQTCTTTANAITYTIAATEGLHTLKAWSKDSVGNVSTTSTDFNIYYDVTNPVISVSNPGLMRGGASYTLNWTLTETYINSTRNFTVEYWNGTAWNSVGSVAATTGPHTAQGFSTSWTAASLDRTDVKIRVSVTDLAGNSTTSESTTFEIDSTAPALTIDSPADGSYHLSSVVVTGVCESGLNIDFTGALQSDFSVACSGGSYSQTLNFSDGDGSKLIGVSQTDAAGNTTALTRTFIRDEVAPVLALTSGVNPDFTNQNTPNTWGGTCEGTYTINITGDETTSIPCSSGTWSWTPTAKTVDGTYNYALTQTDAAGNTTSPALSLSWERDATPPVFNMASPITISGGGSGTDTNNLDQRTLSGSCEGTNTINISGTETAAISCSSSSWTWTTSTFTTDGTRAYTLSQSDSAGNSTSLSYTWVRDTTGPQLTITENLFKSNQNTVTFSGDCEIGLTITVSGAQADSLTCPSGTWSWTSASFASDASRTFSFSQTNAIPNTTTVNGTWIRETNPPTISLFTTTANNPSKNAYIPIDLNATSQNASVYISEVCFTRLTTTPPTAGNECWVGVASPSIGQPLSQTLALNDYSMLLGWNTQTYDMYAWVKDEAGNMSSLTNTGLGTVGTDKMVHDYDPGIAPVLADVVAANVNNSQIPPTRTESSVPAGTDVYIRWKVTDNAAMPAGSVALFYTTDDINYTAISTAQALDPTSNQGCGAMTLAADEGCYLWPGGSPLSTPYKILVKATDATEITTQATSNNTNTDIIKVLAGNTEKGIGGSAQTAVFINEGTGDSLDPGTLVYTDDGRMFFADYDRGVLTVNADTGKLEVFIPRTGTSSGDGGAAVNATLSRAIKITLDYQGRMLIFDDTKIRRVDLNQATPTIETIIGDGTDKADTVANALNVDIDDTADWDNYMDAMPFFAMPNGDIVFFSERPFKEWNDSTYPRLRIYKQATGQVISRRYSGNGDSGDAAQNLSVCRLSHFGLAFNSSSEFTINVGFTQKNTAWTGCDSEDNWRKVSYDPNTFATFPPPNDTNRWWNRYHYTGMDGNLYKLGYGGRVDRINPDGSETLVLGTGTRGECPDGTAATSCNVNFRTFFVNTNGQFFFVDSGAIRVIDTNGNIKTILGQRKTYGDGVLAVNSRFEVVNELTRLDNGDIVVIDSDGYYVKQFTPEGNINVVAGDGNLSPPNLSLAAAYNPAHIRSYIQVDRTNGDLYFSEWSNYGRILRLNRSTGLYEKVVGDNTGTNFETADGLVGLSVDAEGNSNRGLPIGLNGSHLIMTRMKYNSTASRYGTFRIKSYDRADSFRQAHISGQGEYPADGNVRKICDAASPGPTTASTCDSPYWDTFTSVDYDSFNDRWIMALAIGGTEQNIFAYDLNTGTVEEIGYTAANIDNWSKFVRHADTTEVIYYCNGGRIRKYDLGSKTDLGALTWPINNLYCRGYRADYNPTNNSLIFPFEQNGLYGVAEYFLP